MDVDSGKFSLTWMNAASLSNIEFCTRNPQDNCDSAHHPLV